MKIKTKIGKLVLKRAETGLLTIKRLKTNMPNITTSGELYVIATPIGNLDDISLRAISVLKTVDEIVCEDTRHSQRLLAHLNISNKLTSLHNFNENKKSHFLLEKLKTGTTLALISDAGTPLISDPGFPLIRLAREHHITVIPVPGPCALITALCASGLSANKFMFEGFLPAKQAARLKQLNALTHESHTLIFYESTHRLIESMKDLINVFGPSRHCVIAKELTKTFEKFLSGRIADVLELLQTDSNLQKGEFVILVEGAKEGDKDHEKLNAMLRLLLDEGLSHKTAASLAAKLSGCKKNEAYKAALSLA